MRSMNLLTILAFAGVLASCANSRDPAKGFRLAGSGDPQRGKAAFVEFGCATCHAVQGATNLPSSTVQPIVLGGTVMVEPSDGYLVTAIINPAFHRSTYPSAKNAAKGHIAMPEFAGRMTVQQLTDIVVYLKTRYALGIAVPNEYP